MINRAKLLNHLHTKVRLCFKDGEEVDAILLRVDLETPSSENHLKYKVTKIFNKERSIANGSFPGLIVIAELSDLTSWKAVE